jgi:RHS repeat-associated protein
VYNGNERIAQEGAEGALSYFLSDVLGNVRQLADETGGVTLTRSYDPYGNVMSSVGSGGTRYGFTGEWLSSSTNLVYLRARFYDSGTSRFLSKDIWQGNETKPLSYNGWIYGFANPSFYTDPSGNIPICKYAKNLKYCEFLGDDCSSKLLSNEELYNFLDKKGHFKLPVQIPTNYEYVSPYQESGTLAHYMLVRKAIFLKNGFQNMSLEFDFDHLKIKFNDATLMAVYIAGEFGDEEKYTNGVAAFNEAKEALSWQYRNGDDLGGNKNNLNCEGDCSYGEQIQWLYDSSGFWGTQYKKKILDNHRWSSYLDDGKETERGYSVGINESKMWGNVCYYDKDKFYHPIEGKNLDGNPNHIWIVHAGQLGGTKIDSLNCPHAH